MKTLHLAVAVSGLLLASLANGSARADVLNMGGVRNADGFWTGLASLETVPVGNPNNAADIRYTTPGYGSVPYTYNIGTYEVTAGQYCEFLNKVAGVDTYGLYNTSMWVDNGAGGCKIQRFAGSGTPADPYRYRVAAEHANRPVNCVSFGDACRFANWLHNGQPSGMQTAATTEDGAYAMNGATDDATLREVTRKAGWRWAIASEDEWYKAAYYDPASGSYYDYPTSSNVLPSNDLFTPDGGNNANYHATRFTIGGSYWRTPVGEFERSPSPCGTFDQAGNVWEWNEVTASWSGRGVRGGAYNAGPSCLHASHREKWNASTESFAIGFRVVQAAAILGDIDGDGHVNVFDVFCVAESWNTQVGDPTYNPAADLDGDGFVNVFDIFVLAENWNR